MPRTPTTSDRLAVQQATGKATSFQRNLLAEIILDYATQTARAAASRKQIPWRDCEDVAQDAVIKTLSKLPTFNPQKAGLKTFVAVITRSVIGDLRRRYAREAEIFVDNGGTEGQDR